MGTRNADFRRLAEALKGPGIDTRFWSSHGTVGVVDDDGDFSATDENAVVIAADGVWVDVLLQPLDIPITARVQLGLGGRDCTVLCPIHAGDEVLVTLPDGDLMQPPIVVAILNNLRSRLPVDPTDRKPYFRNDRLLVFAQTAPIDIRTAGGARVQVNQDNSVVVTGGSVKLGGSDAAQQLIKGTDYRSAERAFLDALRIYVLAIQSIADPANLVTPTFAAAIAAFKAADNLSTVSRTK